MPCSSRSDEEVAHLERQHEKQLQYASEHLPGWVADSHSTIEFLLCYVVNMLEPGHPALTSGQYATQLNTWAMLHRNKDEKRLSRDLDSLGLDDNELKILLKIVSDRVNKPD